MGFLWVFGVLVQQLLGVETVNFVDDEDNNRRVSQGFFMGFFCLSSVACMCLYRNVVGSLEGMKIGMRGKVCWRVTHENVKSEDGGKRKGERERGRWFVMILFFFFFSKFLYLNNLKTY